MYSFKKCLHSQVQRNVSNAIKMSRLLLNWRVCMWFSCRDHQCIRWELSQQTFWCLVSVFYCTCQPFASALVSTPPVLWHQTHNMTMFKSLCISIPDSEPGFISQSEHFHCFHGFNVSILLFLFNVVHAGSEATMTRSNYVHNLNLCNKGMQWDICFWYSVKETNKTKKNMH